MTVSGITILKWAGIAISVVDLIITASTSKKTIQKMIRKEVKKAVDEHFDNR